MKNKYHKLGKKECELLDMSSVIEDAAYLLTEGEDSMVYSTKGGTCQCRSSRSAGGTCRASSLESKSKSE